MTAIVECGGNAAALAAMGNSQKGARGGFGHQSGLVFTDPHFEREVSPHAPDAWMDRDNLHRHYYRYTSPRPLEEIDAELKRAEEEILRLLREVIE